LPSEDDRRVVKVAITREGLSLLKSIPNNLNKDLLKNISEEEAKQLSDLLDKLR
jgi:DNA-binding MarR family transcriptional regulator